MKTHNNLFENFCSFSNLLKAYNKAKKGCRKNFENTHFFFNLENELLQLSQQLKTGNYQPQTYRYFQITEPKERTISIAAFKDRVVHHALINILEPIYEKIFIYHSYATRKNKGTHKAIIQAQKFMKHQNSYFKSDIQKYFDSINHKILLDIIKRKISDNKLISVIEKIVSIEKNGLPIGNLTSQFFANIYLDILDHYIKEKLKIKSYLRYMDDFIIFSNNKHKLKTIKTEIEFFLKNNLLLKLKEKATIINDCCNGINFLGFRIFPNYIRLKQENKKRILKKLKALQNAFIKGKLSEQKYYESINSYIAFLSYFPIKQLQKKIFNFSEVLDPFRAGFPRS